MAKIQLNQMTITFSILVLLAILPLGGGMLAHGRALNAPAFPQNHHEYGARPERRTVLPVKQLHELNAVLETLEDVDREIQKAIGEKDGPVNISLRFPNAKVRNDGRDETQGVASNPSNPKSVTKKSAVAITQLNSVTVAGGAARRSGQANVHRRKFPRDSFIF